MTTEELVKRLNTNNWLNWVDAELEVNKYGESYVTIYSPFGSEEIAVPCDATNWLNVHYDWSTGSDEFTAPMREFISSLISQYLNTPVSKRKTEKKYRVRLQGFNQGNHQYLSTDSNPYMGQIFASTWDPCYKQVFTKSELEAIQNRPQFKGVVWFRELIKDGLREFKGDDND